MAKQKYQVYRYRWVSLLAYTLVFFIGGPLWIGFAPISSTLRQAFFLTGVSDMAITLLVIGPMAVEIVASFPVGILVDRKGWKFATGLGAVIMTAVAIIRLISPDITWLLIFQLFLGIAFALMYVSLAKLAVTWFPRREGAFAQGLGLIASNGGNMAGLVLTPLLIAFFGAYNPSASLQNTMILYAIATTIITIIFFLIARAAPPVPPEPLEETKQVPLKEGLSRIAGARDFWLLGIAFAIGFGAYLSIADYIERMAWSNVGLLQKFTELYVALHHPEWFFVFVDMEQSFGGLASGLVLLSGIIGTIVITRISDKLGRRKLFLFLAVLICTPALFLMGMTSGETLLIAGALFGFFLISVQPLVFESVIEIKAIGPMITGLALGIILTLGHIGSVIWPLIFGILQTGSGSYLFAELFYYWTILPNYWGNVLAFPLYFYFFTAPPLIQLPGTFFGPTLFLVLSAALAVILVALLKEVK
ncbi:MAG: MFS transporter [Candidatus Jordarchaeum sp.]|uniref:MFS transporter n=1 Tax=Candidatus Jordarchaeum sp. TaxID=2823881 RepID=UPI0040491AD1